MRPLRTCNKPGCPELVRPPARYCEGHMLGPRPDDRRTAAERGYDHRWAEASRAFRRRNPLCWVCEGRGRLTPADAVDHVIPHDGDSTLFWAQENWQSICHPCHNRKTHRERDGFHRVMYPRDIGRVASPCTVVTGPPASGKSTYIAEHSAPGDIVIELDAIQASLSGAPLYHAGIEWLRPALLHRNDLLRQLMTERIDGRVWYAVGAPRPAERWYWSRLGGEMVTLDVDAETCKERIRKDKRRTPVLDRHLRAVDAWWAAYRG